MNWANEKKKLNKQQTREYTIQKNLLFQQTGNANYSICEAIKRARKI